MSTLNTTNDRLAKQAVEVGKDLQEMGALTKNAAQEKLGQLREEVSECYEQGRDQVRDAVSTVERYVREQPFKSLLIAAGLGLLFGRFGMRR